MRQYKWVSQDPSPGTWLSSPDKVASLLYEAEPGQVSQLLPLSTPDHEWTWKALLSNMTSFQKIFRKNEVIYTGVL